MCGEGASNEKINEYQAAWNVTNAIQGMFIVSLPFAVLRGGYWAIIAMVGIAHICCYTGKVGKSHFFLSIFYILDSSQLLCDIFCFSSIYLDIGAVFI